LKKELGLTHNLDITCTFSIFVPKPFTPFQWCAQTSLEDVNARIKYLKEKTRHIKGLKINYHESEVSQIEAVLTRGDKDLCPFIETLYQKGCYLDAWLEHFNLSIWKEAAEECGFTFSENAQHQYSLDDNLPWNIIDIGVDETWFKKEYQLALNESLENVQPSCETGCVNCGVCRNFKTKKVLAPPYKSTSNIKTEDSHSDETYKYRIKLSKRGSLKYFSHLDWQNTFLKALERSKLKLAFSNGFNPTMKVSLGVALPLFMESDCELVDIELKEQPDNLKDILQSVRPDGCEIFEVNQIDKKAPAIDHTVFWAKYKVNLFNNDIHKFNDLKYNVENVLNSQEILLEKKNKKGILKTTNVKPSIKNYYFDENSLIIELKTGQSGEIPALRADDLMKKIMPEAIFNIKRVNFYDENGSII
ncbi:DUF2344 domain-containing protein, partial [bacterium]|nr:DUF2344 domain-containing protein [bacterium]